MSLKKQKTECTARSLDFFPFLKGELDRSDHARVERHLAVCGSCTEELEKMRQALHALDGLYPPLDADEEGWNRLEARIRSSGTSFIRVPSAWMGRKEFRIAASAAVVLGGVCLIWLLKINDQVVRALRETLDSLGWSAPWLTEGPLSAFLTPLFFVLLCSFLMLVFSPFVLKRKKEKARRAALRLEEEKGKS